MKRKPPVIPDFDLWADIARNITPLRSSRHAGVAIEPPSTSDKSVKSTNASGVAQRGHPVRREPPPLTGLDRRSERRMTRGQVEIAARLDLHGTGVEQSRLRLLEFLGRERGRGSRLVLVITGKGQSPFARHTLHGNAHFHTPERQGRLRRLVPEWLHEPQFRIHVAGFQPAHPRHGGGGAFYVKLRRNQPGAG
jgi:DNA-nicking Smr family endonuclease